MLVIDPTDLCIIELYIKQNKKFELISHFDLLLFLLLVKLRNLLHIYFTVILVLFIKGEMLRCLYLLHMTAFAPAF